jgi:hypothetical protein
MNKKAINNKKTITNKKTIINKVLKHYMGAYDFISGDFKNKTIPTLKKLVLPTF